MVTSRKLHTGSDLAGGLGADSTELGCQLFNEVFEEKPGHVLGHRVESVLHPDVVPLASDLAEQHLSAAVLRPGVDELAFGVMRNHLNFF